MAAFRNLFGNIFALFCCVVFRISELDAFTISIGANREKCFHQIATEGQKLYGSYSVIFGGKSDINVKVNDPDAKQVYEEQPKSEGSFEFVAQKNGRYELCLNNQGTSVSTKRVSFSFHVATEIKKAGTHISKYFGSLESAVNGIAMGVYSIQDHHHHMQIRDRFSRQINESTLSRINWTCFFEIVSIFGVCCLQIVSVVALFNKQ